MKAQLNGKLLLKQYKEVKKKLREKYKRMIADTGGHWQSSTKVHNCRLIIRYANGKYRLAIFCIPAGVQELAWMESEELAGGITSEDNFCINLPCVSYHIFDLFRDDTIYIETDADNIINISLEHSPARYKFTQKDESDLRDWKDYNNFNPKEEPEMTKAKTKPTEKPKEVKPKAKTVTKKPTEKPKEITEVKPKVKQKPAQSEKDIVLTFTPAVMGWNYIPGEKPKASLKHSELGKLISANGIYEAYQNEELKRYRLAFNRRLNEQERKVLFDKGWAWRHKYHCYQWGMTKNGERVLKETLEYFDKGGVK